MLAPYGNKNAKIVIIGEAPRGGDVQVGKPFADPSGRLMQQVMGYAGLTLHECYVTYLSKNPISNFEKLYTKTGKGKTDKEPGLELMSMYDMLDWELSQLKPNVIVPLGEEALRFFGYSGIGNYRGSILHSKHGKIIPTYNPFNVQSNYGFYPMFVFDWGRIARDKEFPELRHPEMEFITAPTYQQVMDAYKRLKNYDWLAFDIETIGHEIDCIGFSSDGKMGLCIPLCYTSGVPYWHSSEEKDMWLLIDDLLADERQPKLVQNMNYDTTYLDRHGVTIRNIVMDTMSAHNCVYPELPKSLALQTSLYTRIPYYKDQIGDTRWEYNCKDVIATYQIAKKLKSELEEYGTASFYFDFIRKLDVEYKDVTDKGINIDLALREKASRRYRKWLGKLEYIISKRVGYAVNPNSPKQVKDLLYKELGFDEVKKRDKKVGSRVTADDDALDKLAHKYRNHPKIKVIKALRKYRALSKTLGTYIEAELDGDGRMRTVYVVPGTETGRLSSKQTSFGTGANLQNLSSGIVKTLYIPDSDDYVLGQADLAGADARIVAYVSGDPRLIDIFERGGDIHKENASIMFNIPVAEVTKALRKKAKAGGHAFNYDVSARTLAMTLGVSESEARRILYALSTVSPGVKTWHREIQEQLAKNRTLITPLGRKRTFYGRWGDPLFKEAYAYVPQSTVGDIIHHAFLKIKPQLAEYDSRVSMNIHDSLVFHLNKKYLDITTKIIEEGMKVPMIIRGREVIIPSELLIGNTLNDI